MNGVQRAILACAAAALLLVTFVEVTDPTGHGWLALASFALSVGCFVLAAGRRK